jgi:hypothetical protein
MSTSHPPRLLSAIRGMSTALLFIGILISPHQSLLGGSLIAVGALALPAWWWWMSRRAHGNAAINSTSPHAGTAHR